MLEERKLATILFADIVGSTEAGAAHDPEVVRRGLARAFAEMRQVLEAHGGTVEKFIGDAVMAVFGVPVAHDDDPQRAVRAAFALRERIADLNSTARLPLELRLGVNTGQVVAGTGGEVLVTGPAVNEAARLQQHAAAAGKAGLLYTLRGQVNLGLAQCYARAVYSVVLHGMQQEPSPSAADIQQPLPGLKAQLTANVVQLLHLR